MAKLDIRIEELTEGFIVTNNDTEEVYSAETLESVIDRLYKLKGGPPPVPLLKEDIDWIDTDNDLSIQLPKVGEDWFEENTIPIPSPPLAPIPAILDDHGKVPF